MLNIAPQLSLREQQLVIASRALDETVRLFPAMPIVIELFRSYLVDASTDDGALGFLLNQIQPNGTFL
jgi:hypothetical protein